MNARVKRWAGVALRVVAVLVVIGAGALLCRRIDLHSVGAALAGASLSLVALAAALNLGQVVVRALCLRVMLAHVRVVGTLRLVRYNLGMYAANNLLPGRAGELVRVHLLKARDGVPASTTIAVALVEKVFDVVALLVLVLPLPLVMHTLPPTARHALWLLGAIGALALVASWLVVRFGARGPAWLARIAEGASSVSRPKPFAAALGLSVLAYAIDAAEVALCMAAVGIPVDAAAPLLVLLGVAVALSVPSTPSSLGALELGAVAALRLVGVDPERALAFALIYHFMQLIPVTLLGLDGIRLAALTRTATTS